MRREIGDIPGAFLVDCPVASDSRGTFITLWESAELVARGCTFRPQSAHCSFNERAGTVRGLHFQRAPHEQAKLVACVAGRIWDVIVDLRPESATFMHWAGHDLDHSHALFVPKGCAHGFLTLDHRASIVYLIEGTYTPEAAGVIRWNDPRFAIDWPVNNPVLSDRDRHAPDFIP